MCSVLGATLLLPLRPLYRIHCNSVVPILIEHTVLYFRCILWGIRSAILLLTGVTSERVRGRLIRV